MRRYFGLFALLFCLTACGAQGGEPSQTTAPTAPAVSSAAETEPIGTKPAKTQQIQPAESVRIADGSGVLSQTELDECDDLAAAFSDKYLMEIAVSIVEDLDGSSPADFAKAAYETKFSPESTGFLILINNETGEDYVYCSGACPLYLTDAAVSLAIAQATPLLVEGEYAEGVKRLLELAELMPTAIFDRCHYLTQEQSAAFLDIANAAMPKDAVYSVLLTKEQPELQSYADIQRGRAGVTALLVIDVQTKQTAIAGDLPDKQAQNEALTAVLQEAEELPVTQTVTAYYDAVKAANEHS